jgi:hypothetical protein
MKILPKIVSYNIKQNPNLVAILSNENVNMINDIYKKVFIVLAGFLFSEIRKIKRINKYTNTFSPIKSYQKCTSTHYLVRNGTDVLFCCIFIGWCLYLPSKFPPVMLITGSNMWHIHQL